MVSVPPASVSMEASGTDAPIDFRKLVFPRELERTRALAASRVVLKIRFPLAVEVKLDSALRVVPLDVVKV